MKAERISIVCKYIIWLVIVLYVFMIYKFSAQTGVESKNLSLSFSRNIISSSADFLEHLQNTSKTQLLIELDRLIRKIAHFLLFFLFGILSYVGFRQFTTKKSFAYFASLVFCGAVALLDEFHQSFVNGRGPQQSDVGIDVGGALAGLLLIFILQRMGWFLAKRYIRQQEELK